MAEELTKFFEFTQDNIPVIIGILGIFLGFLWLAVVVWVLRDISTRTKNLVIILFSALFVAIGSLPALIIYLLIRPSQTIEDSSNKELFYASILDKEITACPSCGSMARTDFKFCPNCGEYLIYKCRNCNHQINPAWKYCINCNIKLISDTPMNTIFNRIVQNITIGLRFIQEKLNNLGKFVINLFRINKIFRAFSNLIIKIKLPVFQKNPKLKVMAQKRHEPKIETKAVVISKVPNLKSSQKKTKGRGRPRGSKDSKPRRKRADAGKSRGAYKA